MQGFSSRRLCLGLTMDNFASSWLKNLTQELLPHSTIYHPLYSNHFFKELFVHIKGLSVLKYIRFLIAWFSTFNFREKNFSPDVCIYGSDMIFHLQLKSFLLINIIFVRINHQNILFVMPHRHHGVI